MRVFSQINNCQQKQNKKQKQKTDKTKRGPPANNFLPNEEVLPHP